ncbi:DUF2164 domain-containing protein [Pullulanibacillus sp. KACC 23026]|uniref:DUF2164 domain-containing protein n=1 Tax=Pullulanibacillus sp. KACC 23026 TaxID=3028315 RepID=UPI0023AF9E67|nr:DUF2164 domain-containing protein [Pullulanibacillus sp. KACC 23026]WEG10866.1 DUF2164 domain-containing protein [Pullulanibacillus sp. KACC 23026]
MLSTDEKKWVTEAIQEYFYNERGEELGLIAAQNFLEFMTDKVAPIVYNRAIRDVKQTVLSQLESIDEAVEVLMKPVR